MSAPPGSILPASFFDGLSQFWGAAAFVASSIAATGFVFSAATGRHDPIELIKLVMKLFFVGLATLFLRQWLMRLGDIIVAFDNFFGVDPSAVDDKYIHFLAGTTASKPDTSVWDVIWNTGSIGTAIAYALLWIFGWLAYGVQYIVNLIGGIFLTVGWALSPIFISFFMLRPMAGVGLKYITGLAAIVCWPFGWSIASVVTNAMLDAAATASLIPVIVPGGAAIAPILTVLLVGLWLIVSSALAPYVTWRILISGANPAAAFAQGVGGVAQGALAAGVGAATAAVTGGSSAGGVVAAAALGAMAGGTESAARGGGNPQTTGTAINGMAGFYRGQFARRQVEAMEEMAASNKRRADAAESFSAEFSDHFERRSEGQSGYSSQPHDSDPNQAAIDIEAHDKS
jgi:type IV secretion system protein TrbL